MNGEYSVAPLLTVFRNATDTTFAGVYPWSSGIAFGEGDTHGYLTVSYNSAYFTVGGGYQDRIIWQRTINVDNLADKTYVGNIAQDVTDHFLNEIKVLREEIYSKLK